MAIKDRNLEAGTRLVAKYKGETHVCTVEKDEAGKTSFVLGQGTRFTSPSAAASAVMGGIAANGWRFWSVEGEAPAPKEKAAKAEPKPKAQKTKAAKPRTKKANGNGKLLSRAKDPDGLPEGQARWWCNACMESFVVEGEAEPEACPQGHRADDPELTAPVSAEEAEG